MSSTPRNFCPENGREAVAVGLAPDCSAMMRSINNLTSRMTSAWVWGGIWANDGVSSSDSTVTDVDDDGVSDEALTVTSVEVTAGMAEVCPLGVALAAPSTALTIGGGL